MAEVLSDSALWAGLLVGCGIGVMISRLLHHPWPVILINLVGTVAFFAGLRWAIAVGEEAFLAAAAASGGAVLWDSAARLLNRHRRSTAGATAVG